MLDDPTTTLNRLCDLERSGWHWTRYLPGAGRTMRRRGAEIVLLLEDVSRLQKEIDDIRTEIDAIHTIVDAQEAEAMRAARADWTTDDIHAAMTAAIQACNDGRSTVVGPARPIGDPDHQPAVHAHRSPRLHLGSLATRRSTGAADAHRRR